MIELKTGTRIWIAAGFTDLRRGFQGLSSLVETVLEQQPYSGHVFVFRGKRGHLIKLLWFDGDGLCLFQKRLERGRFVWPQATSGTIALTRAQLSMLLEGIDWRRVERTRTPEVNDQDPELIYDPSWNASPIIRSTVSTSSYPGTWPLSFQPISQHLKCPPKYKWTLEPHA